MTDIAKRLQAIKDMVAPDAAAEISALRLLVNTLEAEARGLKALIEQLRAENARLRTRYDSATDQAVKYADENAQLREQLDIARLALNSPMLGDIPP